MAIVFISDDDCLNDDDDKLIAPQYLWNYCLVFVDVVFTSRSRAYIIVVMTL